ncbi:class I SAM-dependent methyltransferase [Leptospira bouyouniensis]|uniref:Class I SAM-dependent methyltransferase n=1 Tax=Leptospira bouyouniensis TaxID=2484911 RepID=A0A7I0HN68_9LEPT|nr:class I SAM-dependent methyltransferase [Leptospira bouyouniensis]TGK48591.1 class I SAM-dependent methyltransferase [Leptospira bouyouniensis]TGL02323.1 class I SAM-dependent methyltransferase [Leptospira bouyouniensis]
MSCYLCGSTHFQKLPGKVRDNDSLNIFECDDCHLVYLSGQEHVSEEHYKNSGMHGNALPSIQEWLTDTQVDDERRFEFLKNTIRGKDVLDFGCGNGGFLIKAKGVSSNCYGVELERRLQDHFTSNSLKVYSDLENALQSGQKFDVITSFHVLEHLSDPSDIMVKLALLLKPNGKMIFEIPSATDVLLRLYESKEFSEFTYWSQHLYLFNANNLVKLVDKAGLKIHWIKQVQRYPLSNHLFWLSKGKPGGHIHWSVLNSEELNRAYEASLASIGMCDTLLFSVYR